MTWDLSIILRDTQQWIQGQVRANIHAHGEPAPSLTSICFVTH